VKRAIVPILLCGCLAACAPGDSGPAGVESAPRLQGKWLVINYWAIWCAPCRREIPELNAFARTRGADTIVYAVNYDDVQGEELLAQATELGIEFSLLTADPAASLSYARPTVLPTTMIISPDGKVWARLPGPQTEEALAEAIGGTAQKLSPPVS